MLGADVLVAEALRFFRRIGEDALALVRKGQVDAGWDRIANDGMAFDLLADGFHGSMGVQEAVGECLVFAQQAEEEVVGLNVGRAELAGFVTGEEDHAARFFGIAFEHRRGAPGAIPEMEQASDRF